MTAAEWEYIGRQICVRKKNGKISQIFFNGSIIPAAKVKKEVARNFFEYRPLDSGKLTIGQTLHHC